MTQHERCQTSHKGAGDSPAAGEVSPKASPSGAEAGSVLEIPGDHSILDDLFQGCALAAFLETAVLEQSWPSSECTRRLAYRYYEEALAEKNRLADTAPARQP